MKICRNCSELFDSVDWQCPFCNYSPAHVDGFPTFAPELAYLGAGFHPEYFQELATLETHNFWFRNRNQLIIHVLHQYFPNLKHFLEIGCGTGFVLSAVATAFPSAELTGSEVFVTALPHAAVRLKAAELLQMDAHQIPYSQHFDVIGAFDVLEHIQEDELALQEIHRALKPGGGLILTVPQHQWLWSRQDELACHVRRYSTTELSRKVTAAGFKPLYQTSFISLMLPVMWMSRLIVNQKMHPDPLSELKLNSIINHILGGATAIERWLITIGLRFPIGGSLLLLAIRN